MPAGELWPGEALKTESGTNVTITGFALYAGSTFMWDLTVDGAHTFFVGPAGVLVHNCPEEMLGQNGVQTTSSTMYQGSGLRIDVENPSPGVRPGQLHAQFGATKYLYDFNTGSWRPEPGSPPLTNAQLKMLATDAVINAIRKGGRYLGTTGQ